MAIVIAACTSFMMSIGHQVDVWLNAVLLVLTALILPLIWLLNP
jgi:hypothetical protein